MAYTINRYNNAQLTTVQDGTIDQTTDIKLVGKNYAGYGEIQNENFIFLLENFSGNNAPPKALSGQIWFDAGNSKLKFYDGNKWRTTGGAEVAASSPAGLAEGDFWWDTTNEQLYAYGSDGFVLVGPQDAGDGITQMQSRSVKDTSDVARSIITATINDAVVFTISTAEFTLNADDAIPGFTVIREGVTLKGSQADNGVTTTNDRFHGTATSAEGLVIDGVFTSGNEFVTAGSAPFTNETKCATDAGITVGASNDLQIKIINDNQGVIANSIGDQIRYRVKDGGSNKEVVTLKPGLIQPGLATESPDTAESVDIGSTTLKFNGVHANNFYGTSEKANFLIVGGNNRAGSVSTAGAGVADTVAVRDGSGNLRATEFQGLATSAKYADLAEMYTVDKVYPFGTVMKITTAESWEVEDCQLGDVPIGVLSTAPAYLMNADCEGQAVGLKGRVPVRVVGPVNKGQAVYVWEDGVACAIPTQFMVGVALETNAEEGEKLVECVLKV